MSKAQELIEEMSKIDEGISDNDFYSEYLAKWEDDEQYSDVKLALSKGMDSYAIYILDGAGYFDGVSKDVSDYVEKILKKFNFRKENKELLKNVEVWVDKYNVHAFIPVGDRWVDYFVDKSDMIRDGYKFNGGYDKSGKPYKESKLDT